MTDKMQEAQTKLLNLGLPIGSRWEHFKGGTYKIIDNLVFEEDLDLLVSYQSEQTGEKCARRLSVFTGVHPDHGKARFTRIE